MLYYYNNLSIYKALYFIIIRNFGILENFIIH